MKLIRSRIAEFINSKIAKREELALQEYTRVKKDFSDLTEQEDLQLTKDYYAFLRFNVDEFDHADIDEYSMGLALQKEKVSGRKDLYLWWYLTTYLFEIGKWKVTKLFQIVFGS